jgi:hypothetical protein
MDCIGCQNFYYSNDGRGQCDMPYKEACLNNNFQFKVTFPRGLRATTDIIENCLIEDKNILDIFLHENLENTPPPPFF